MTMNNTLASPPTESPFDRCLDHTKLQALIEDIKEFQRSEYNQQRAETLCHQAEWLLELRDDIYVPKLDPTVGEKTRDAILGTGLSGEEYLTVTSLLIEAEHGKLNQLLVSTIMAISSELENDSINRLPFALFSFEKKLHFIRGLMLRKSATTASFLILAATIKCCWFVEDAKNRLYDLEDAFRHTLILGEAEYLLDLIRFARGSLVQDLQELGLTLFH
jgi:hypothetical protein